MRGETAWSPALAVLHVLPLVLIFFTLHIFLCTRLKSSWNTIYTLLFFAQLWRCGNSHCFTKPAKGSEFWMPHKVNVAVLDWQSWSVIDLSSCGFPGDRGSPGTLFAHSRAPCPGSNPEGLRSSLGWLFLWKILLLFTGHIWCYLYEE